MNVFIHPMYFLPDYGSAPVLMNELAGFLAARGHRVEVVATIPRRRPRDLSGLVVSHRRERGFTVKRFWTNSGPRPLSRLLAWNIYTAATLLNLAATRKGDVLFLRTPPLQLGLTGFLGRRLRGAKVLLNVQDIHPDLSIESGILRHPAGVAFARALEKWVYGVSDRIVVISEGFRANLLEKGVAAHKLSVIPNWVDTDFLRPLVKDNALARRLGLADKFVLLYAGTVSISSNLALERVLEAARPLAADTEVVIAVVGEGLSKKDLERRASELKLRNVRFFPFQPYADLPALLAAGDVLLVPLDREKSWMSVPSKLYAFMAAGRPVLALAPPESEVAAVIRETGGGAVAPPDDPGRIAQVVAELKNDPAGRTAKGAAGRDYVVRNLAKTRVLRDYEETILSLAG